MKKHKLIYHRRDVADKLGISNRGLGTRLWSMNSKMIQNLFQVLISPLEDELNCGNYEET